jgi:hypothetical protein
MVDPPGDSTGMKRAQPIRSIAVIATGCLGAGISPWPILRAAVSLPLRGRGLSPA